MIESWRAALVRAIRRGRPVLVPLLAVLITAHLASAAHSASFSGTHGPYGAHPPQLGISEGQQPALVTDPAHDHDSGEHVDHALDRPRDPGTQELAAPALPHLAPAFAPGRPAHTCVDHGGPPGRGGERSLLGVWRQ
ncbi:hypothetical protein H9Y04_18770 [Streptomyces sp. TRM66268-LWL]|uniref:Secreted protein n=1 Tax=Streptomyces polyasparticus TaxID=2767826 RepID=A0ABR7SHA0_9ACTN|nr:hypothetical protein [Streptomyces polyasparticus]MBC9714604.1 hypothetical protein [Streptomyces polyasparticus]